MELIVTGRRDDRNAEIQETPISITSLSGDKLVQQGITSVRELGNIVPNLYQARTAVSYLNATFFLRGIGEPDAQGEPPVPVYFDGVYVPKTLGSQSELLAIERVEVLRGPQGHAFGHSAPGGTILSTVPDETPRLRAQVGYGSYDDIPAGVALSGPIAPGIFAGGGVSYHNRDGFSWDTWSPRLSVDYAFTPDLLGYATYSRGTKSAGFDYRAQAVSEAGRRQAATPFDSERITNYEFGLKTEWLGGRLRANVSAF